jgi:spermidine/putrescine transport system substrate-binding protein
MKLSRRKFNMGLAGVAGAAMIGQGRPAFAARESELNILCWEGYNTDNVLGPFRDLHPGARVRAESGTSDPDMINRLRAGELNVWDVLNVNQPWARRLALDGLIKLLD